MTQEQKAKAYDEALERAKKYLEDCMLTRQEYVEKVFPELKESEDEKIRKWLLDTITQIPNDSIEWDVIEKAKVLAWLEKQGEQSIAISVDKMVDEFEDFKVISCGRIPSLAEIDAYRKGVTDALSKILIKEEKPITIGSKKAEGKLGEMIAASKEPAESGEDKELSHKEVTKKSDKGWSEEDEIILNGIIDDFGDGKTSNMLQESWLKSIKDRMQ